MNVLTHHTANNYKIVHIQKETPISLVLFFVKNGSRFETAENSGISHFLEHMMFKPTPTRTTSKAISMEIESIGGMSNAFTSFEYTGYYIQVLKENFDKAFEILSDLTQNGIVDDKDIAIEKGVVIEEIRMYEDSPSDKVGWLAHGNVFPNQALGRSIIGTEDTVNSFTSEQIKQFIQTNYLQDDFLVVSVGDFDIQRTIENTQKHLKSRKPGTLTYEKATFSPLQKINSHIKEDSNQAHTIISFEGVSMFDSKLYNYMLTEMVLGGGMGSILFDLLREKLGVAYYVHANHSDYLDTGVFDISFGANFDRTKETIDRIFEEIQKLKKQEIHESELNRAKNLLYSSYAMRQENAGFLGRKFGIEYLLTGKFETLEQEKEQIFAITTKDILETANKIFNDNYNITYIANKELL